MSDLIFRKLERWARLTHEDREALANPRHFAHFEAHEDLAHADEATRHVNLILEGWVCRYKQLQDGRRQILSFFVPGDACDLLTFHLEESTVSLSALTPVRAIRLSINAVKTLISRNSSLERAFWLDMLVSAEMQREWIVNLGRRTASERMAHLFCELFARMRAVGLSSGTECEMPVTQHDLADALGLSAVHVNRTLQDLRRAGLVELRGKKLRLLDGYALRDLAMFDPKYLHLPPEAQT